MTDEQVMQYDSYIYYIISKFYGNYPNKEDLFQAGRIGLWDAYTKFDASQGTKFTTYAFHFIRGKMSELIANERGIKTSRSVQKLKLLIEKASIKLAQELMRYPTTLEISNYLGIPEADVCYAMQVITTAVSIDEPMVTDGKEMTYHDITPDNRVSLETHMMLKESLESLNPMEYQLIKKRYLEGKTQSEIAEEMGMNQVQVSRKVKKINDNIYHMVA